MAVRFVAVTNEEFSQINNEGVPDYVKKVMEFGLAVFIGKSSVCLT